MLGAVLGVASLVNSIAQADAQRSAQNKALKAAKEDAYYPNQAKKKLYNLAENYDPTAEASSAIDFANLKASNALEKALKGLNAKSIAMGANPTDTAFLNNQIIASRGVLDPLREYLANIEANKTAKKAQMYGMILGNGGANLSDAYFKVANPIQPTSMQGGYNLLAQSLSSILGSKGSNAASVPVNTGTSTDSLSILNQNLNNAGASWNNGVYTEKPWWIA